MKTWIDTETNLEWLYDLDLDVTWEESQEECPENYRLATIKEFMKFLDHSKHNPAVTDECPFGWSNTWTSEQYKGATKYNYWFVNFITGSISYKDQSNKRDTVYVRNI